MTRRITVLTKEQIGTIATMTAAGLSARLISASTGISKWHIYIARKKGVTPVGQQQDIRERNLLFTDEAAFLADLRRFQKPLESLKLREGIASFRRQLNLSPCSCPQTWPE